VRQPSGHAVSCRASEADAAFPRTAWRAASARRGICCRGRAAFLCLFPSAHGGEETGGRRGPCQSKRRRPRRCGDLTGLSPPANVIALPASDSFPPRFGSFISFFSLFFKAEKSLSFSVMRLAPSVQASGTHGTLVWLVVWRLGAVFPDLVG
jgi:hypothetical protein